jgi:hypothetical protein
VSAFGALLALAVGGALVVVGVLIRLGVQDLASALVPIVSL